MRRLKKCAGLSHMTAHALRQTFAINCLRNGMNIYVLARLMGHSDIMVLKKYLPLVEQDMRGSHEDSGPIDHMT